MATFVWAAAVAGNWNAGANWQVAGVPQASPPTAADDVLFGSGVGATNSNVVVTASSVCRSLVMTGYTGTMSGSGTLAIGDASGGIFTLAAGATYTLTSIVTMSSTSNNGGAGWAVTSAGAVFKGQLEFNGVGGQWFFADDWSFNSTAASNIVFLTNGTLNDNGKNISLTGASGRAQFGSGTTFTKSGTWTLSGTTASNIWNMSATCTFTDNGGSIIIAAASANTRTFVGAGKTYKRLTYTVAGSTGQLTITGVNTFDRIDFSDVTNARTLSMPTATVTTITTLFNVNGTSGKLMSVVGDVSSPIQQSCDFLSISSSDATNGPWYAGANSTDGGGNTGWNFTVPPAPSVYVDRHLPRGVHRGVTRGVS